MHADLNCFLSTGNLSIDINIYFLAGGGLTPCQSKALQERSLPSLSSVTFTYRCKKDGSYEEVQCQKFGICWCVDEDGNEIPGTRSSSAIRCPRKGKS